ncbi:hypothetical protein [Acinetobacter sp.]|uniref:hypothetical protein n=1 Tax=Acinetobacter sp. TaxID=472 RepID=UPI002FC86DB3
MHDFDGTNPLLEALGDEAEIKEIALTNESPFIIVEPLTQVRLLPFEKTVIRVKGKAAHEQITANIKQLNALKSGVLSIEASEPEDDLDSLPWLSSQDQAVFDSMAMDSGLQAAGVGTVVTFKYTNQNAEKLRAKIGFHIGGVYSDKEVAVEIGGGEWEFTIPERGDYPDGEYPIEFKYGGEDLLSTAFYLVLVPFFARPYPWVAAGDGVVIHGVLGADLQPLHAAKYGDPIFIDVTTAITKPSRMAISLDGIDGDYETVVFPGRDRALFILPERVETGDAAKTILIKGEAGAILDNIPIFNIMNAAVDESTLMLGGFQGFFANGMGGTVFYPADALINWTSASVLHDSGSPLESGSANDVFPRKITLAEDSDNPIFEIRKAQGGAPNNYGYEVRLKDGAALSSHEDFVLHFTANQDMESESSAYLTGHAYVFPEQIHAQVQVQQTGAWVNFADWDDAVTLSDETELNIRLGVTPETWTSVNPTVYELVSAAGESGITVDWENGKILFGSPAVTDGTENLIEIVVKISPDGIGSFNAFNATLNLRRIKLSE